MKKLAPLLLAVTGFSAPGADPSPVNPFFVFDNGTGRQQLPLEQQADLVKKTGYAGIGYTGTERIPELLKILDDRGLRLFSIYTACRVDRDDAAFDPGLPEAIRQLRGRGAVIWLTVQGKAPDGDERAVALVRQIADLAAAAGVRVVLYPHVGFHVERIEDALRIRALAGRPNVGVSFNLAHFLALGDEAKLEGILREAGPYLEMVSVNGADHEGNWKAGDWSRLIQTLDRGEFDVNAFVSKLRRLGYKGPVGLQCYKVPGDIEENLRRSMAAWRAMQPQAK